MMRRESDRQKERRFARRWPVRITAALIGLIGLGLSATQEGAGGSAPEATWPPREFPITFWCGPPEPFITNEQYRQIAEAGFTVVMPPCEGEATPARNRKILDTARATGLKAILSDARMPLAIAGKPGALAALKAIVADYKQHPALLGYFLTDEPGADRFDGLADVVDALRKLDPNHMVYINLLPNYASTNLIARPSQLNTDSYDQYLERFVKTVKPDVLSWDHYPLLLKDDRPGFFGNLASGQRAALSTQPATPFWQIVLAVQHGPYRSPGENELRFEAMQTLAYGAQGLAYFTYWQPNDPTFQWSNAICNRDGTPGPLYEPVKKVNREVKALMKWLYGAQVLDTFQTGDVPPEGRSQPGDALAKGMGPGELTVGTFRDRQGYVLIVVTNRNYTKSVTTTLQLNAGKHPIETLNLATNRWQPGRGEKNSDGNTLLSAVLPPAGAVLIRWR